MQMLAGPVLYILLLVGVNADAILRREDERPYLGMGINDVRGRQVTEAASIASYICGYQGGDEALPWVCDIQTLSCMVEPVEKAIGCCESNYCGAFRTACYAPNDPCDSNCTSNTQNTICTGSFTVCATYSYPNQITEVKCESTTPTQTNIEFTYTGYSKPIGLPRYVESYPTADITVGFSFGSVSTDIQIPSTSTVPTTTPSPILTPTTSTTLSRTDSSQSLILTSTTSNPTSSTDSSTSNAGAIAGGVVGGLAVIAILAGFVLYLRYKREKSASANAFAQSSKFVQDTHPPFEVTPSNDIRSEAPLPELSSERR